MNHKPIPFRPEMVRALLEGRKTMTRRAIKRYEPKRTDGAKRVPADVSFLREDPGFTFRATCPYGLPGDLLWVRERMRVVDISNYGSRVVGVELKYEADGKTEWATYPERLEGNPVVGKCLAYGGHKEASRLTLLITDVRVERLHDISQQDALEEGVESACVEDLKMTHVTPVMAFGALWNRINDASGNGWATNPLVWAISFSVINQNILEYMQDNNLRSA